MGARLTNGELKCYILGGGCTPEEAEEAMRSLAGRDPATPEEAKHVVRIGESLSAARRDRQTYQMFLDNDPRWKELRRQVVFRSGGYCETCNSFVGDKGAVHHLTYGYGWAPPLEYLRHLCHPCHGKCHPQNPFEKHSYKGASPWK